MFIGHFGVALGARKAAPKISLGTFFLAAQFLDLLWPLFLLLRWERVKIQPGNTIMAPLNFTYYPFSHSLLLALIWSVLFAIFYFITRKNGKGAVILGLCVLSHWFLDLLVHKPDLPLYPGSQQHFGLGLWNHPVAEVLIEGIIFITGLTIYLYSTKARNKKGLYIFWLLIILLTAVYVLNLSGTPPSSANAIAWAGMTQWILVILAYWADANRVQRYG